MTTHSADQVPEHLRNAGFVLYPTLAPAKRTKNNRAWTDTPPMVVGTIPNLPAFSQGDDVRSNGFLIKDETRDTCILPAKLGNVRLDALLPTIQGMVDRLYATRDFEKECLLLRVSRHTAQTGEAHQSHIPHWHDHRAFGDSAYLLASDTLGTRFRRAGREATAPNGAVVEFNQNEEHATPIAPEKTRRTLIVMVAMGARAAHQMTRRNGQVNANPAESLLARQPYQSFDQDAIYRAWHAAAQVHLAHNTAAPFSDPQPIFAPVSRQTQTRFDYSGQKTL